MSGGFFRGTSAEQDTRFSNKQAKLLKSQKFPPELDHLVDMTKVNMDVIRPWIATRATELLGFEDEVLINFVYGLLDVKEVDGKQIQIQLTGFMEKNTGKFMRELWALLLSAQNNASGVPQQFLDAKEEEMKKKKEENDRITQEIQKRKEKEGRDLEEERQKRMDEEMDNVKTAGSVSKHSVPKSSNIKPDEERNLDRIRESRTRSRKSPPSRSRSKSVSKSRSSREGRRSRSASVSSEGHKHSVSPKRQRNSSHRRSVSVERRFRSPPRRSTSPRRRYSPRGTGSPLRRRSPYSRRRSPSISRHRSPSPIRRKSPSPIRRRSPSPIRRSPSPIRRRSPFSRRRSPFGRRRSPSPLRRRSPVKSHRRSTSPPHYRSPVRRKFSPGRRRSPSPAKRSSPLQRSPRPRRKSPLHSPKNHGVDARTSPLQRSPRPRRRSPVHSPKIHGADSQTSRVKRGSPFRSPSPSYPSHRSFSRETDSRTNSVVTKGRYEESTHRRTRESAVSALNRDAVEHGETRHKLSRSPLHKSLVRNDIDNRDQYTESEKSQSLSVSPRDSRKRNPPRNSAVNISGKQTPRSESPRVSEEEQFGLTRENEFRRRGSPQNKNKDLLGDTNLQTLTANDGSLEDNSSLARLNGRDYSDSKKKEREQKRSDIIVEKEHARRASEHREEVEYDSGRRIREEKRSLEADYHRQHSSKKDAKTGSYKDEHIIGKPDAEKQYGESYHAKDGARRSKRMEQDSDLNSTDSDPDRADAHKSRTAEKRKHKKSGRHRRDSDFSSGSDSETEDKKEAKRRRKEEKKLRKEDRRRRREERHRKRSEHSGSKANTKLVDTVPPPDFERKQNDADTSGDEAANRKGARSSYVEESEQKKLEIELREKALETLRAKKAINH